MDLRIRNYVANLPICKTPAGFFLLICRECAFAVFALGCPAGSYPHPALDPARCLLCRRYLGCAKCLLLFFTFCCAKCLLFFLPYLLSAYVCSLCFCRCYDTHRGIRTSLTTAQMVGPSGRMSVVHCYLGLAGNYLHKCISAHYACNEVIPENSCMTKHY